MTCYYPLLGLSHGIVSSVTYSTFTHNERTSAFRSSRSHLVDLALYRAGRRVLAVPGSTARAGRPGDITLTSAQLGLGPGELVVVVPLARGKVPDPGDGSCSLPPTARRWTDRRWRSGPAWRSTGGA